jgi:hypothetical protein
MHIAVKVTLYQISLMSKGPGVKAICIITDAG